MPLFDRLRRPDHRLTPLGWAVLLSLLAAMVAVVTLAARLPGANLWWLLGLGLIGGLGRLVASALNRRLKPAQPPGGQPSGEGHRDEGGKQPQTVDRAVARFDPVGEAQSPGDGAGGGGPEGPAD